MRRAAGLSILAALALTTGRLSPRAEAELQATTVVDRTLLCARRASTAEHG